MSQSNFVHFTIGPARPRAFGSALGPRTPNSNALICLAMCAARHGRTKLLDQWGGAVVFSNDAADNLKPF